MARAQARSANHKVHKGGIANKQDAHSALNQNKSVAIIKHNVSVTHGPQVQQHAKQAISSQTDQVKPENHVQTPKQIRGNSIQGGKGRNDQFYKATVVNSHPDVGFESGAWIFDRAAAPQWLVAQLPQESSAGRSLVKSNKIRPQQQMGSSMIGHVYKPMVIHCDPDVGFESGAWLFEPSAAPQWLVAQLSLASLAGRSFVRSNKIRSQQQVGSSMIGQVYKTMTIHCDPDVGFESGAWLFHRAAAPQWLASQLQQVAASVRMPIKTNNTRTQKQNSSNHALVHKSAIVNCDPDVGFESGAWLFDDSAAPQWLASQVPRVSSSPVSRTQMKPSKVHGVQTNSSNSFGVYKPKMVNSHPDVGFESGAWLFDCSVAPQWLVSQLPLHDQPKHHVHTAQTNIAIPRPQAMMQSSTANAKQAQSSTAVIQRKSQMRTTPSNLPKPGPKTTNQSITSNAIQNQSYSAVIQPKQQINATQKSNVSNPRSKAIEQSITSSTKQNQSLIPATQPNLPKPNSQTTDHSITSNAKQNQSYPVVIQAKEKVRPNQTTNQHFTSTAMQNQSHTAVIDPKQQIRMTPTNVLHPRPQVTKQSPISKVQRNSSPHHKSSDATNLYFMWSDKSLLLDAFGSESKSSPVPTETTTASKSVPLIAKNNTGRDRTKIVSNEKGAGSEWNVPNDWPPVSMESSAHNNKNTNAHSTPVKKFVNRKARINNQSPQERNASSMESYINKNKQIDASSTRTNKVVNQKDQAEQAWSVPNDWPPCSLIYSL